MKNMDKNRYFQIRSGKCIKTKVADIQRLYSKWLWLVTVVYKPSFPDAEIFENMLQNAVRSDSVPGDGAEVGDDLADFFAQKIGRKAVGETFEGFTECLAGR